MKLFEGIWLTLVQFPHPSVKQREECPGKVWVDEALWAGTITFEARKVLKNTWRDITKTRQEYSCLSKQLFILL